MIYIYPNTTSTFTGRKETAIKNGYIEIDNDIYTDLVEGRKKWINGNIVNNANYEIEKAEKERTTNIYSQLAQAKEELKSLDYIGVKIATGRATIEEYKDKIDRMNELSNIINNLENQLKGAN